MRHKRVLLAAIAIFLLGALPALADDVFDLSTGNSAISGFSGPYAQVDIHWIDSTHATITFTSLTNSGNIYLMGDGGTVGVNVNATSWSVSGLTSSNAGTGFSASQIASAGSGNEDGFGSFNQTFDSFDGFTHSSDTVTFELTDNSGTWASALNVLAGNNDGNLAAAHIFVTLSPANANNGALTTGFASNGSNSAVPEPSSLALLGSGLIGLGAVVRRRLGV